MTENEEENKQSDKKRKKVTILSGIQKENVTEDEESKSERTTVRTPIRTYVHTHIHTHQDSKEKSKKMLLGDIPSHLLEAFKKVREEAEKEGTYLDFDIFLTQLREKAEKEEELARFLESKRDSYRLIYLLKHIKIGHFTEIKEALGISENKTLIRLIRQLGIRLKSADNLRFDVRYKQRVLKKIIRQDTKSYYELGSLTKEELEGAEHFISEGFRRQVEEKKTTFEQATKEFDAYEIAELKRIEEKEKPLLDIVWGYVNSLPLGRMSIYNILSNLKYDQGVKINKRGLTDILKYLERRKRIEVQAGIVYIKDLKKEQELEEKEISQILMAIPTNEEDQSIDSTQKENTKEAEFDEEDNEKD